MKRRKYLALGLTLLTVTLLSGCPNTNQNVGTTVIIGSTAAPATPTPPVNVTPTPSEAFPTPTPSEALPTPAPTPLEILPTPSGSRVTSVAGDGSRGFKDGEATTTQFNEPTGITVDTEGHVLISDQDNHRIRKLLDGQVSTIAGRTEGYSDGAAGVAQFKFPAGIAVDSSGTIYVADAGNHRIRQIVGGNVVTMAGTGEAGFKDGKGSESQFNSPWDVAVDHNGNVYVADPLNNRIRKVTPAGDVTTLAGTGEQGFADGLGAESKFNTPNSLAVDQNGNVYVADTLNNRIRKITPGGVVSNLAGTGEAGFKDGRVTDAQFNEPLGVTVDRNGNVYVSDTKNHRIRKISPDGLVSTVAGSTVNGFADGELLSAKFNEPRDITVDKDGNLYLVERLNDRIRKITL